MTILQVTGAGLVTVQDAGRDGYQADGVPRAGALDGHSYRRACLLISGNVACNPPALEVLGGRIEVEADGPLEIAVTGGALLHVDGRPATADTVHRLLPGRSALVERAGPGPAYLAVAGLQVPMTLGSCATDTFSGLGPTAVRTGDQFEVRTGQSRVGSFLRPESRIALRQFRLISHLGSGDPRADGIGFGPLLDRLDPFLHQSWTVQSTARSGLRLRASEARPSIPVPDLPPCKSGPTLAGAIQLAPSGEVIILGPDGAVTGGYPTVGAVISADASGLSHLVTGDRISFWAVSVRFAAREWAAQQAGLARSLVDPALI